MVPINAMSSQVEHTDRRKLFYWTGLRARREGGLECTQCNGPHRSDILQNLVKPEPQQRIKNQEPSPQ